MIYAIKNTAPSSRIFYDVLNREIRLDPGALRYADIDNGTLDRLLARNDLLVEPAAFDRHAPFPIPQDPPFPAIPVPPEAPVAESKPTISVTGHFGIGDNLHQRAVIRELMKTHEVWLHTCHFNLWLDLIEKGLKLVMRPTSLHAQAKTIARERQQFTDAGFSPPPQSARSANIGYPKVLVDQYGSILEAMFGCLGLTMPDKPDFSLPIKPEWRKGFRERWLSNWPADKPLMVHRPVVLRREWDGRSRNPDPKAYDNLFRAIADQFFVVSIADLAPEREWIDGPHQDAQIKLHGGELTFEDMAALFAEARLVFCNAGFAPVLAQAVGTPSIVVYGGRESYRTTQRVGAHLAPTLPIDVINPCDCHTNKHNCDKRIDMVPALERVRAWPAEIARRDILLFGTFYIDSLDRDGLTDLWKRLHVALNERDCDFLAIDSASPIKKFNDWTPYESRRHRRMVFDFSDNIGHLSRPKVTQGRDGWGRAFCKGLEIACELGYEFVVHVEGDSLFRLNVGEIVQQMRAEKIDCATCNVTGTRTSQDHWVETGLMVFSTDYIKRSDFVKRYDWSNRKVAPTPERYIRQHLLNRGVNLKIMPWKAWRADKNQITKDNVLTLGLDWVTHQHDSAQQDVYRKFVEAALARTDVLQTVGTTVSVQRDLPPLRRLNLGCGTNKLAGWDNHDADCDITKPLPFPDWSASHIFIEHCVEHITYKAAIEFFNQCRRVLAPRGVLRVTVPSLEQIIACDDIEYFKFTQKWQPLGPTKRGAAHAIIYAHGHETVWNAQMLRDTLFLVGFDDVRPCKIGESDDPVLRGVEGHGRVISDRFNRIESISCEARMGGEVAAGRLAVGGTHRQPASPADTIAVVIGGAANWADDLQQARSLIGSRPVRYFYINDHIGTFPERGVGLTLHPDKLVGQPQFAWLQKRRAAGLPEPEQIWSHRKHPHVTHDTASKEWRGSSGLFGVMVAVREGHRKIIGCGVPMTIDSGHFVRQQKWQSAISFRQGWITNRKEIDDRFRSMSGWTREQFGMPDEAWLS